MLAAQLCFGKNEVAEREYKNTVAINAVLWMKKCQTLWAAKATCSPDCSRYIEHPLSRHEGSFNISTQGLESSKIERQCGALLPGLQTSALCTIPTRLAILFRHV